MDRPPAPGVDRAPVFIFDNRGLCLFSRGEQIAARIVTTMRGVAEIVDLARTPSGDVALDDEDCRELYCVQDHLQRVVKNVMQRTRPRS